MLLDEIKGSTILDVGSGVGKFLRAAKGAGWTVQGVEYSTEASRIARERGIPTTTGTIDDASGSYDAITFFDVLEHLTDPVATLKQAYGLLNPGGWPALSVPNVGDPYCLRQPWPIVTPPIHVNFFGKHSMKKALDLAGFKEQRIRSYRFLPTATVKSLYGTKGLALRLPYLLALKMIGRAEGSMILATARRPR